MFNQCKRAIMFVVQHSVKLIMAMMSCVLYRIKRTGLGNIPHRGAAVIVCNHVSFVDAIIIAASVRRRVRFVMYKGIFDVPVLNWFFKLAGAIPIDSQRNDPRTYQKAFERIQDALSHGQLVCIFPEGQLTRDGEMNTFKPGVEKIISQTPVPVVPMALKGLWGSFFSHEGRGVFKPGKWRFWSQVEVKALAVVPPEQVAASSLHKTVCDLRGGVN